MRVLAVFCAALAPALAVAAPPAPGRYDAELCVASGTATPSCGKAELTVHAPSRIDVRVADIVYRLRLRSSQLDVATSQGTMQIDDFSAPYEWVGAVLRFRDADKGTLYEVRTGARRKAGG